MHRLVFALFLLGFLTGCGPAREQLFPVRGKVTLNGQPWAIGEIGFFPDPGKGNTRGAAAVGLLMPDGNYELFSGGKSGVPPGWYKAVVWGTNDPAAAGNPWGYDGKLRPIKWLVPERYTAPETTPLTVEVVEAPAPGHYDLKMTK